MMYVLLRVIVSMSLFGLLSCSGLIEENKLFPSSLSADSLAVTPVSPSNNTTPTVTGTTTTSATVKLYSEANCSGLVLGTGKSESSGEFSIVSSSLTEGAYALSILTTTNTGGSACSSISLDYVVDTSAPIFTISEPSAILVNSSSPAVTFQVYYVASAIVNLVPTNVLLNATGTADCQITIVDGTTLTPTVSLSSCTGSGTIRMSIDTGSADDSAGNQAGSAISRGLFSVDNTSISTAIYSPDTGTYNATPSLVTITLAESIDGTTVTSGDFNVSGTCGVLPSLAITNVVGAVISVSLSGASCSVGETVILTTNLSGISDPVGNPGVGSVAATYTIDNVGPTSATFNPAAARVAVIPSSVTATFDEAITAGSVSAADFTVSGTCTTLPTISITNVTSPSATISLVGANCSLDQTVILTLDLAGVSDAIGNLGVGSSSVTYTYDNIGPAASSINPATSSVAVIPATVAISFSENLLSSSVASSDLIVSGTCATLPTASLLSVTTSTATFTLANEICSPGQTVVVTMNGSAITDDVGNVGMGSVSATYTLDATGPVASSTSPTTGTVNLIPATVTFYFDEALLSTSVATTDVVVTGTCSTLPTVSLISVSGSTASFGLSAASCASG